MKSPAPNWTVPRGSLANDVDVQTNQLVPPSSRRLRTRSGLRLSGAAPPHPDATGANVDPGGPLLISQACGLTPTSSPSATSVTVPTLGPPLPTPREGEVFGYDRVSNDVVMLGGQTFSANGGASQTLNDVWTLDSQGWHEDHPVPRLTPVAIAEDPLTGRLIMVGSPLPTGEAQQTWSWDGNAWNRLADLPGATDHTVGLAALADQLVLVTENSQVTATQTWVWTGASWYLRHPATNLPLGAAGPVLSADPLHHRVIAVLAAAATAGGATQTWAWNGSRLMWSVSGVAPAEASSTRSALNCTPLEDTVVTPAPDVVKCSSGPLPGKSSRLIVAGGSEHVDKKGRRSRLGQAEGQRAARRFTFHLRRHLLERCRVPGLHSEPRGFGGRGIQRGTVRR